MSEEMTLAEAVRRVRASEMAKSYAALAKRIKAVTVSVGSNAMPAVQQAITHGEAEPEHKPFIRMDIESREISWMCYECLGIDE